MIARLVRRMRGEKGAALPTIAILMTVLLGMAAFAVDLGWVYLNSNRLQKTADAAALAGVVHLPSDLPSAYDDANGAVSANGWAGATMVATPLPGNQLQVDLTSDVDTFFLGVFGIDSMQVSRRATAQYILPVPLGNDSQCFGCPGAGFWAAINTPATDKIDGDPFQSLQCGNQKSPAFCGSGGGSNPEARTTGYFYAIEIPEGAAASNLRVNIYDAAYNPTGWDADKPSDMDLGPDGAFTTTFTLRSPDSTPYYPDDNPVECTATVAKLAPGWFENWRQICNESNPADGIWVLQVDASGAQMGSNQFAIEADLGGSAAVPKVYGLNDMSLFNNKLGTVSQIKLAEIESVHAGKTLEIGLFDPGDASGVDSITLDLMTPSGLATCSYHGQRNDGSTFGAHGSGPCTIQVRSAGSNFYNGAWVRITLDIPSGYSCTTDCWWYVDYDLSGVSGGQVTDRTTWTARVIGNPVRLVPNHS